MYPNSKSRFVVLLEIKKPENDNKLSIAMMTVKTMMMMTTAIDVWVCNVTEWKELTIKVFIYLLYRANPESEVCIASMSCKKSVVGLQGGMESTQKRRRKAGGGDNNMEREDDTDLRIRNEQRQ